MDERISKVSALANAAIYNEDGTNSYVDGAPHIKHAALRTLYGELVVKVFDQAKEHTDVPTVLDLGAGEGAVTKPFLQLGAKVTAVDLSQTQLAALADTCSEHADDLEIICDDVIDAMKALLEQGRSYDIVVANSFLHHVPDYVAMIRQATTVMAPTGRFFSFQDPLRYDTVGLFARLFCNTAFISWRLFKGDVIGGIARRVRRMRGVYLDDCPQDNAEYHVVRNGVDQDAIKAMFDDLGYDCEIIRYFSTLSSLWQPMGTGLGVKNTFAVLAARR